MLESKEKMTQDLSAKKMLAAVCDTLMAVQSYPENPEKLQM